LGVILASFCWYSESAHAEFVELAVYVNNFPRAIKKGEPLLLTRGDLLVLERAHFSTEQKGRQILNFIGFRNSWKSKHSEDDSHQVIDTSRLKKGLMKDIHTESYAIKIKQSQLLKAEVVAEIRNPRLISIEVFINEQQFNVIDNGVVRVSENDKIKIGRISSDDESINHQLLTSLEKIPGNSEDLSTILKVMHGNFEMGRVYFHSVK
jgi:hypothetical protein